jgi:hypothetical protein
MPQPPEASTPPPLVIHQPRFFTPLIRRPERIIYGYGDASQTGAAGHWSSGPNVFLWRIPMGVQSSQADTLSRWRTQAAALAHSEDSLPRPNVVELLRRLQTQESVQDVIVEEFREMEYVD